MGQEHLRQSFSHAWIEYIARGLPEPDVPESTWIAENHHRHRMAQLQEDHRNIPDGNTPVERFQDRHAHRRKVGSVHRPGGQLLSEGRYPPSPLAEISKIPAVRACPSYDKAVQQLWQRTSSPRISDIGSDRDADQCPTENAFRDYLACLDPSRVSTPMKVGSLPYVLRLDRMDQAVAQATPTVVDVEVHRPPPTPALRTTVPVVSRQRHRSSGQALPNGVGSESDEDNCSLPVMNLGRSTPPQPGDRSRPSARPVSHSL